jgi:hypothetical protein
MRATIISNMREGPDVKIVKGRTIVVNCREEPVAASAFYPWPRARTTRAIRRSRGSARGQAGYRSASAPAAPPVGLLLDEESRLCRGRRRFAAFVSISSSRDIAQRTFPGAPILAGWCAGCQVFSALTASPSRPPVCFTSEASLALKPASSAEGPKVRRLAAGAKWIRTVSPAQRASLSAMTVGPSAAAGLGPAVRLALLRGLPFHGALGPIDLSFR